MNFQTQIFVRPRNSATTAPHCGYDADLLNELLEQLDAYADLKADERDCEDDEEDLENDGDFQSYDVFEYRRPRYLADLNYTIVKFRRKFVDGFSQPNPDPLVQQILDGNDSYARLRIECDIYQRRNYRPLLNALIYRESWKTFERLCGDLPKNFWQTQAAGDVLRAVVSFAPYDFLRRFLAELHRQTPTLLADHHDKFGNNLLLYFDFHTLFNLTDEEREIIEMLEKCGVKPLQENHHGISHALLWEAVGLYKTMGLEAQKKLAHELAKRNAPRRRSLAVCKKCPFFRRSLLNGTFRCENTYSIIGCGGAPHETKFLNITANFELVKLPIKTDALCPFATAPKAEKLQNAS